MCRAHATVRGLVGELVTKAGNGRDILIDMEAGLEHLSRGTGRNVSRVVAVLEPYFRSMETVRRIAELAQELEIAHVTVIANKVRDAEDHDAIVEFCRAHRLEFGGEVPYDASLLAAERAGKAPIDHDPAGPAVSAIRTLAGKLVA